MLNPFTLSLPVAWDGLQLDPWSALFSLIIWCHHFSAPNPPSGHRAYWSGVLPFLFHAEISPVLQALFLSPEIERRVQVCMYIYTYISAYICMYVYIYIYIYIYMGAIYYKVLAYVIMETENSPDLSAICKLQTQESQWSRFQPEAEGPRTRSAHLRAEDWCIGPCLQTKGIQPSWAFYSIRGLDELDDAHPRWGGHCFPEPTDLNAKLLQKYPHRHIQKGCLTRGLGTPWSSQVDTRN